MIVMGHHSAVPLDLFYPNGTMRRNPKINLLNDIEIK